MVRWQKGYVFDCKSKKMGSIPVLTWRRIGDFEGEKQMVQIKMDKKEENG